MEGEGDGHPDTARSSRPGRKKAREQEEWVEEFRAPSVSIIREIYDSDSAQENFELQLERSLADGIETIVIEPYRLGDETARWIAVGNCLHKTAVLAGFGSILAAFVWPDKPFTFVPATILSTICTGLYSISWQFDPCCKYQVEKDPRKLARLTLEPINSSSPVVLVKKDDARRKFLHCAVTGLCLSQTVMKLYWPNIMRRGFSTSPIIEDTSQRIASGNLAHNYSQMVMDRHPIVAPKLYTQSGENINIK